MKTLQEALEARKQEIQNELPEESQEVMRRALKALLESGAADRALGEGDTAPDFTLTNAEGESFHLRTALDRRPVVLGFYRGRW